MSVVSSNSIFIANWADPINYRGSSTKKAGFAGIAIRKPIMAIRATQFD